MMGHKCSASVTGKHLFCADGMCHYCAIDIDEIRQFLPSPEAALQLDREASETAIRDFFTKRVEE